MEIEAISVKQGDLYVGLRIFVGLGGFTRSGEPRPGSSISCWWCVQWQGLNRQQKRPAVGFPALRLQAW